MNYKAILNLAVEAGYATLDIYNSGEFNVEYKTDDSPLTRADIASNTVIAEGLKRLYPELPVISEEGKDINYETRSGWKEFFLVDPLDGTKEFIKRNGEFTINIAFIKDNYPVFGVVYAPVLDVLFYGVEGSGAFRIENGEEREIKCNADFTDGIVAIMSRSHAGDKEKYFFSNYKIKNSISRGSSLKFCMVAEGKADIYYRSGPTMEWDTGAGQAVLESAGGAMLREDGERFHYNKKELLNPGFACYASKELIR